MKCAKRRLRIYEVPISYHGRTYEEGKKIGWRDGVKALGVVLKFWLIDDLYREPYGRFFLNNMAGTPQYLNWITSLVRPYLGDTVLEVGAGLGAVSGALMGKRLRYVAAEREPLYLHALRNRFLRTPNVEVRPLDPSRPSDFARMERQFETVLCINVLEHEEQPDEVVRSLADCLEPGGRLIVLVPQAPSLLGTLDQKLGNRRRFTEDEVRRMAEKVGLIVDRVHQLNRISTLVWWFFGRVMQKKQLDKLSLKIFDKTVWLWRLLDPVLPWKGLSLVLVARKK
jgi:2-polyprenyl-3-methyl-5-hydroxy-6-metoxy-1,4-benzoquinol methylase